MLNLLKKIVFYTLAGTLLLSLILILFMQQKQFGKNPTGTRLERVQQSPNYRDGAFQNQSPTPDLAEGVTYWHILRQYFKKVEGKEPLDTLPSVKTDLKVPLAEAPTLVWFGHSSYFIRLGGKTILVDPVLSGYASPVSFFGKNYLGSNVYSVDDFPEIDVLIITHDHYDHLDYQTVLKLKSKVKKVVTSLGVGAHLVHWGYDEALISELDWYEEVAVDSTLKLTAAPARHFSGRSLKRNQTLWSSFMLQTPEHKIYLGGDSGYDKHFKELGQQYGPFDLAVLECGQYNAYWKYIHMMPEETAQAALDLRAKVLMPVHWSKFTLALHPWNEPIERVTKQAQTLGLPITTPKIGEAVILGEKYPAEKWWRR
ncbi:MBL fold metallo-hydrolase [Rhabdobacter roseus]|uniref:L-ascorbate metabolism protein UlaG (Beta-lactamase superfamily) n=1 Tax=Rhabdobacter roseus TaxID=1655419 RepID=A0A840TI12_9BACT|nr:MBL fold metallo-hydrolase [Rhabdobacter roseus]MBB5282585.1 L-ascorbate metabolism protein UlaG (beta-lactamase superfamily) [Rhabdobacter roseus]